MPASLDEVTAPVDELARARARRLAKHMAKAFWVGVVSAVLMVLSGGFAFMPGVVGFSLIASGVNVFAAYAINQARLVTTRFPVTHRARVGQARGDVTAGFLAVLSLLLIGMWVTHFME